MAQHNFHIKLFGRPNDGWEAGSSQVSIEPSMKVLTVAPGDVIKWQISGGYYGYKASPLGIKILSCRSGRQDIDVTRVLGAKHKQRYSSVDYMNEMDYNSASLTIPDSERPRQVQIQYQVWFRSTERLGDDAFLDFCVSGKLTIPSSSALKEKPPTVKTPPVKQPTTKKVAAKKPKKKVASPKKPVPPPDHATAASPFAQPFRTVFPIDFNLFNNNDEPAIFVTDHPVGPDHRLTLTLSNRMGRSGEGRAVFLHGFGFKKTRGKAVADASNHHFELRFRPGVLSTETMQKLTVSASTTGWAISPPIRGENSQWFSAFLLKTDIASQKTYKFDAGKEFRLELDHVSAGGKGGSRGTVVELRTNAAALSYDAAGKIRLAETRIHHVNIVNHRGKKHIPLHVEFVSAHGSNGNRVLNNNTPQSLVLRITNTSNRAIALRDASAKPTFILSFQSGPLKSKPWALGTVGQVGAITVNVGAKTGHFQEAKDLDGNLGLQREIIIDESMGMPASLGPMLERKPGDALCSFEIKFENIITAHPAGQTNLYVNYKNIPGYWDGQFICGLEKRHCFFLAAHWVWVKHLKALSLM